MAARLQLYNALGYDWTRFPKQAEILRTVDDSLDTVLLAGGVGASKSWTSAYYILPEIVLAELWRIYNGWPTYGLYPEGYSKPALPDVVNPAFEPTMCWIVGDNYEQPRKEWSFIYNAITRTPFLWQLCNGIPNKPTMPQEGSWHFETGIGVQVTTKSWDNPESLHSEKVPLMIGVEAGLLSQYVYEERLLPRVIKAGGLMVLNGTFETTVGPFFGELYEKGLSGEGRQKSFSIASWENPYLYPGGYDDPQMVRARETTTADRFQERYGAKPRRPHGLAHPYFAMAVHVYQQKFERDPKEFVRLGVDVGSNGYAVVCVQFKGEGRRKKAYVFDEYFDENGGTSEKAIGWLLKQEWCTTVSGGAIDRRAPEQQRIWASGAVWSMRNPTKLRGVHLNARHVPIQAGLERVDTLMHSHVIFDGDALVDFDGDIGTPRLFIHPRCKHLIWELSKGYRFPKEGAQGEKGALPVDKNNHLAKALAYLLVDEFGFVEPERKRAQAVLTRPLSGVRLGV